MQRRAGFTLVEMLVAVALVLFIMVILTEAFVAGLDTFSKLKAIGDMEERLRTATTALRHDLAADHFEGRRRLSDLNFWIQGPPREGFFRIWQPTALTLEGRDGEGIVSSRATNHALHFMVKLRGNRREDFLSASLLPTAPGQQVSPLVTETIDFYGHAKDARYQDPNDPTTYNSQWAEVVYFLRQNGSTAGGTPLFALYRRQLLAVPDNRNLNWPPKVLTTEYPRYFEISCKPSPTNPQSLFFNNPTDLTVPQRRYGLPGVFPPTTVQDVIPTGPGGTYPIVAERNAQLAGADLLLTDIISFEVKVLLQESLDRIKTLPNPRPDLDAFVDLFDSVALANGVAPLPALQSGNPLFGNSVRNPNLPRVFDTWSSVQDDVYNYSNWDDTSANSPLAVQVTRVPLRVWILAVQITLRVWDVKAQQARQITIVQEM